MCFSTPFDETALKLLEKINCPFYKISSFEMTDIPLIKEISLLKKPVVISTGTADLKEIEHAVKAVRNNNNDKIILLHCVSAYPTPPAQANLLFIGKLRDLITSLDALETIEIPQKTVFTLLNDSSFQNLDFQISEISHTCAPLSIGKFTHFH